MKEKWKNSLCAEATLDFALEICSLSHRTVWQTRKYADYARDVPKRYWLYAVYAYESELSGCSTNEYRNRDIFIALSSCLSASGYQGVHLTLAHTEFAWLFRVPHTDDSVRSNPITLAQSSASPINNTRQNEMQFIYFVLFKISTYLICLLPYCLLLCKRGK